MTFRENSNIFFAHSYLGFTKAEFSFDAFAEFDAEHVIHEFINAPQDFDSARKYVGGYTCDHTNEFGERSIFQLYEFGSYDIKALDLSDYKKSSIFELEKEFDKLTSDFYESYRQDPNFKKFKNQVSLIFQEIMGLELYLFSPSISKFNELGAFELEEFVCGFAVDNTNKKITVIQVACD